MFLFWFVFVGFRFGLGQTRSDYFVADAHALRIQHKRPDSLSYLLTRPFPADTLLQVRAMFRWITENIAYNSTFGKGMKGQKIVMAAEDGPFQSLDQRVAWQVLQRRTTACEGYARLFKTLCDYAGIRCELVHGFVKNSWEGVSKKFTTNHTWNAIYLNGAWRQMDVTWASGYTSGPEGSFTKRLDEQYFLFDADAVFRTHYPEHFWWSSLTPKQLLWDEYRFTPYRFNYFVTHRIQQFAPQSGIVEGRVGDTLQFVIRPGEETRTCYLSVNPYDPAAILDRSAHFKKTGDNIYLQYLLTSNQPHWLYLVHNDDVVLRYFIQPKPEHDLAKQQRMP